VTWLGYEDFKLFLFIYKNYADRVEIFGNIRAVLNRTTLIRRPRNIVGHNIVDRIFGDIRAVLKRTALISGP